MPVFETILASCERLFAGKVAQINLVGDDGLVRLGAYHGPGREDMQKLFPFPPDERSATGLAHPAPLDASSSRTSTKIRQYRRWRAPASRRWA